MKNKKRALLCAFIVIIHNLLCAAEAASPPDSPVPSLETMKASNMELRERLEVLEKRLGVEPDVMEQQGQEDGWSILKESKLSGFAMVSFFHDTSDPADGRSNGYLWSDNTDELTLNKVKLTLENPASRSATDWDAGYHVSAMFGTDARFLNPSGGFTGMDDIRQAYVDINVPVGEGLNIKAGQLISLWNFESGDGGTVNPNFSQGNQWYFTGNPPGTGVQLSYPVSEKVDFTLRAQNGFYAGAADGNNGKTLLSSIGIKPNEDIWFKFNGVAGPETSADDWLTGAQMLAGVNLGTELNLQAATELSYLTWESMSVAQLGERGDAVSAGLWLWGDFTEKLGFGLRADVVNDQDGSFTSGLLGFPANPGQEIYSTTLTVTYKPIAKLKIQPEVRYDTTTLAGGYDGDDSRWTIGLGASYTF
ncbi:MAG: outer membrane beta-barrel protein [Verrucomicrobiota bacterium]|nr:outer membrane beta-barrel protein [Verrucomicrobiota bacterium]